MRSTALIDGIEKHDSCLNLELHNRGGGEFGECLRSNPDRVEPVLSSHPWEWPSDCLIQADQLYTGCAEYRSNTKSLNISLTNCSDKIVWQRRTWYRNGLSCVYNCDDHPLIQCSVIWSLPMFHFMLAVGIVCQAKHK